MYYKKIGGKAVLVGGRAQARRGAVGDRDLVGGRAEELWVPGSTIPRGAGSALALGGSTLAPFQYQKKW
eukprot:1606622-Rhodomonas_salina.1